MRLRNKIAIVTGGSSGIGKASSILFAKEGAKIIVADINDKAGEDVARMIKEKSGEATFVHCDVTKENQARDLISKAVEKYSRLDVLYNNAGIGMVKLLP